MSDSFAAKGKLTVGNRDYKIARLSALEDAGTTWAGCRSACVSCWRICCVARMDRR